MIFKSSLRVLEFLDDVVEALRRYYQISLSFFYYTRNIYYFRNFQVK